MLPFSLRGCCVGDPQPGRRAWLAKRNRGKKTQQTVEEDYKQLRRLGLEASFGQDAVSADDFYQEVEVQEMLQELDTNGDGWLDGREIADAIATGDAFLWPSPR